MSTVQLQGVGVPFSSAGFVKDAGSPDPNAILFVQVPNSGAESKDQPSFKIAASGKIDITDGGLFMFTSFRLGLSLQPEDSANPYPYPSFIASTGEVLFDSRLGDSYRVEANVAVSNGYPTGGTWKYFQVSNAVDTLLASGTLSNFPIVPYPMDPSNPGEFTTTTKVRRTLVASFYVVELTAQSTNTCTLTVSETNTVGDNVVAGEISDAQPFVPAQNPFTK